MCGIVGVVSTTPIGERERLTAMRETLRHRGPDGEGLWWSPDRRAGLAHRRLAIVDVSPTGRQPMSDASGSLHVTYNGEIYNHRALRAELTGRGHRFVGRSDTEVLLAAYREWGTDCLSRFNGMFAFALHDAEIGRVFLARDRVGEKPLFYWRRPGALAFASELKALMADPSLPRRIDVTALDHYLAYGYVPAARCILEGVAKLEAGHAMTYDVGSDRLTIWRYWSLPLPEESAPARPVEEWAAELEALLGDSVRLRLEADVPVGVLLSGGVDSSLVAALAARDRGSDVRTFTVTFPGDPDHDEAPYARLVARHLGTTHTEIPAEPDSLELLGELARQFDEPMADSSMIPTYLVSRAIRPHAKAALGGDGGDELFGGYPHYRWIERSETLRRALPRPVRALVAAGARALPAGVRGRHHLSALAGDLRSSIAHVNLYFDAGLRRRLLLPQPYGDGPEQWRASLCPPDLSALQQATRADLQSTLVDAYLVKVDRASMLASLEVRSPWLDHRLVELAFARVPDALKVSRDGLKLLPRHLAGRLLPASLDIERKQGLSMPFDSWLRDGCMREIETWIDRIDSTLFDAGAVRSLLEGQQRGRRNAQRIFALALFEAWRREYRVSL